MVPLQIDGSLCETLIDFCKQNWFVLLTDLVHSRQWGVSGFESWQKKKKTHKETVMHSNEYVNIETCYENAKKKKKIPLLRANCNNTPTFPIPRVMFFGDSLKGPAIRESGKMWNIPLHLFFCVSSARNQQH